MVHGGWARQDVDLSYLNAPNINTLVLVAGFDGIGKYFRSWGMLMPPEACLRRLFTTPNGVTIQQQIERLTEVCRMPCSVFGCLLSFELCAIA